jgi:myo-inositol-1(or 4)-monophosphatase
MATHDGPDLTELVDRVADVARAAGTYLLKTFRSQAPGGGSEKAHKEFVSQADIGSERLIADALRQLLPRAEFYGEETSRRYGSDWVWVVDPLDGTSNYLAGLDQWSVSIALVRRHVPVLGVVHKPFSEEVFGGTAAGAAADGAWYERAGRRHRLEPRGAYALSEALVGTGFPYRNPETSAAFFGCAAEVLRRARGIRRLGSAALDLCYVGAGFLQGFWEYGLQPYDVAAALVVLYQTGCLATDFGGDPYEPTRSRGIVAGPRGVHEELQAIVAAHYADYA